MVKETAMSTRTVHSLLIAGVFFAGGLGSAAAESNNETDQFCISQVQQCYKDCEVAEEGTKIRRDCDNGCLKALAECEDQANKSDSPGSRVRDFGGFNASPGLIFQQQ